MKNYDGRNAYHAAYKKTRYQQRKEAGLCIRCGTSETMQRGGKQRTYCKECTAYMNAQVKKREQAD